jgi:hypothetical protein
MAEPFDYASYIAQKQAEQGQQAQSPGAVNPSATPVDQLQLQAFDPNAYIAQKQNQSAAIQTAQQDALQAQSGTSGQQLLAGIEGFARGQTLGGSDVLETQLSKAFGAEGFSPQAIQQRMQANPYTSGLGSMAGGAALGAETGGFGLGAAAGTIPGTIAIGGAFGAGNAVTEAALGDPQLSAQKVLSDIGWGAATGLGLGLVFKGAGALLRGSGAAIPADVAAQKLPAAELPASLSEGKPIETMRQMEDAVEKAKSYAGMDTSLPERPDFMEAAERLGPQMNVGDYNFAPNDIQTNSLNSLADRENYKSIRDLPGPNQATLQNFEGAQKKVLTHILDDTIQNQIAPGYKPTTDAAEAGSRVSDILTNHVQAIRDEVGPAIEQIKSTPINDVDHLPGVIDYLTNPKASPRGDPAIAKMFETAEDGTVKVKPYDKVPKISQPTYSAIKRAIGLIQDDPKNFQNLFDARNGLDANVDITGPKAASSEIGNAKAAMMDYIQDLIQKADPNVQVRDTFKRYAVNEANVPYIEKQIGAKIGDNWRSLAKGKPEEAILNKIFTNSATTERYQQLVSPAEFKQTLADHMAIQREEATAQGAFKTAQFARQMKGSQYSLNQAFSDNPAAYQRMKDAITIMRTLPDSANLNPSGTAKSLMSGLVHAVAGEGIRVDKAFKPAWDLLAKKFADVKQTSQLNAQLSGASNQAGLMNSLQSKVNKVNAMIQSGSKGIFSRNSVQGGLLAGSQMSDGEFKKITERLQQFTGNPQSMMDHMSDNTDTLHQAAPNITQGIQNTLVQGTQFLQSKLPQAKSQLPLSASWEPSTAQKNQFAKYYNAVDQPVSALKQVQSGLLDNETMEALQAVHPQLLSEMRQSVIKNMKIDQAKELSYAKKLALAKFLGQPLDESMLPQAIQANQMIFNPPPPPAPQGKPLGPKTRLGGLKNLKASSRTSTSTNRQEEE